MGLIEYRRIERGRMCQIFWLTKPCLVELSNKSTTPVTHCQIQGANSGVDNRTSDIRWSVPRRYTYTTPDQVIS